MFSCILALKTALLQSHREMGRSEEGVPMLPFPSSFQEPWESEKQQLPASRSWPDTRNSRLSSPVEWDTHTDTQSSPRDCPHGSEWWISPKTLTRRLWPQWIKTKTRSLQYHILFSHSVVYNSLWPHELQFVKPPCPSLTPRVTQTHVHWVGDAKQPSHSLLSPSPLALSLSQHQGLLQWDGSSHQVARVL